MMATATSLNYMLLYTCLTGKALLFYSLRRMRQREGGAKSTPIGNNNNNNNSSAPPCHITNGAPLLSSHHGNAINTKTPTTSQ
jgi:hypothetical protein